MSLRQVLTIYNAERQLTDDETALLNTLRRMNDSERQMFIDGLAGKSSKKSTKKPAGKGGGGRSARGESIKNQLSNRRQEKPATATDNDGEYHEYCTAMIDDNGGEMECGETVDHNRHHKQTDANYHQFVPSATHAATTGAGIQSAGEGPLP